MAFPLAAAIAGGVSLINGVLQGGQNRKNRISQERENQKARDYNTEMWNKNNAYNSPVEQMKRLKEANINPHLAYSNGTPMNTSNAPASSNASSMPAGVAPQMDINGLLQAMRTKAEIKNIEADTKQKETSTEGQELINGMNKNSLDYQLQNIDLDLQQKKVNINVGNKNIDLTDENIKKTQQEVTNLISTNQKLSEEINAIVAKKQLDQQQTANLVKAIAVMQSQIQANQAEVNLKNSSAALNSEIAKNQKYLRANLEAETRNKNEIYKQLSRGNVIGEKFDLSNADYFNQKNFGEKEKMLQEVFEKMKQNKILDQNINYNDVRNTLQILNGSLDATEKATNIFNPFVK